MSRPHLFVVLLLSCLFIGMLLGANQTPILTGAGYIKFPENAIPAYIYASGGALTAYSGGSNQNISLVPSGIGIVNINQAANNTNGLLNITLPTGTNHFLWMYSGAVRTHAFYSASDSGNMAIYNSSSNAQIVFRSAGISYVLGNFSVGQSANTYPLDVAGDINTSGVVRVNGTGGLTGTYTVRNSAGSGTCTLTYKGGVLTSETC
jgi:hypothetical protein